jgi:membrane-associated phospholipid phosphatase
MKALILRHRWFFSLFFSWLIIGTIIAVSFNKVELHYMFNQLNHPSLDAFMAFGTHLAEGISIAIVAIVLLSYRIKDGLLVIFSTGLSGVITQLLKRQVFDDYYRPSRVFEDFPEYALQFVEGVELHTRYSFPSGHTTAAFALCFSLAIVFNRKSTDALFFALALFMGYTRIYLSQHFFMDLVAGSFVGVSITSILAKFFYLRPNQQKWFSYGWHTKT